MDHFIGFDELLRLWLGRDKTVHLYGPRGIIRNIEGKLAGYTWNLTANYRNSFTLEVVEVRSDYLLKQTYRCQAGFVPAADLQRQPHSGDLVSEPSFTVSTAILDHFMPCLGFAFKEVFHININKTALEELNLRVGPWLKQFKEALYAESDPETAFTVPPPFVPAPKVFLLKDLSQRIARITPGRRIAYITDASYHAANRERMIQLAHHADHLFIEAAFLDRDAAIAAEKGHLTAGQAGRIAAKAGVKRLTVFHFSPRYTHEGHLLVEEAQQAFKETL